MEQIPPLKSQKIGRIKTRVKILAKSLGELVTNAHHQALTCWSLDVDVAVTCPREYEFSCTSTPHVTAKSKSKRHYPCSVYYYRHARQNIRVHHALLGGPGKSPLGEEVGLGNLQPLIGYGDGDRDDDDHDCEMGSSCVDKAAEEFIERFYRELRLQKLYFPSSSN